MIACVSEYLCSLLYTLKKYFRPIFDTGVSKILLLTNVFISPLCSLGMPSFSPIFVWMNSRSIVQDIESWIWKTQKLDGFFNILQTDRIFSKGYPKSMKKNGKELWLAMKIGSVTNFWQLTSNFCKKAARINRHTYHVFATHNMIISTNSWKWWSMPKNWPPDNQLIGR